MSGILGQMLMGGVQSSAAGISDQIKEEARQKRAQALQDQRFVNSQQLQNDRIAANKDLEETRQGNRLSNIDLENKNALARQKQDQDFKAALYEQKLKDSQGILKQKQASQSNKARREMLTGRIEALDGLEKELTKIAYSRTDEAGAPIGLSAEQTAKLKDITMQKSSLMEELNRTFQTANEAKPASDGVNKGNKQLTDDDLISMLSRVTPGQEHEFLGDLSAAGVDEATQYRAKTLLSQRQGYQQATQASAPAMRSEQQRRQALGQNTQNMKSVMSEMDKFIEGFRVSPRRLSPQEKQYLQSLKAKLQSYQDPAIPGFDQSNPTIAQVNNLITNG